MSYKYPLPEFWVEAELQDFCLKVADGTHDSPKQTECGKLLVTSKNIIGGTLNLSKSYYISDRDFHEVNRRSKVDVNDVLISMIGTVGEVCLIESEPDFAIKNVGLLKNNDPLKAKWLYFYLTSPQAQAQIKERMRGTTQQYLPLGELRKFPIIYPNSRAVMRKVVGMLGALQDKIQLNHQIIQTLEQMAQSIFRSWFVDFEPTKAKISACDADGSGNDALLAAIQAISGKNRAQLASLHTEQPEHYAELRAAAELFPAAMQVTELGEIPEGWGVKPIGEILDRLKPIKRYTKKQVASVGTVPVFEQGIDILMGFHNDVPGFIATPESPVFIFGDHTCITHLSCQDFDISQNVIPLKGRGRPTVWTFYALQGKQKFQEYRRHWSELIVKDVIYPPAALCEFFAETVIGFIRLKEQLVRESENLKEMRGVLLPKIFLGELSLGGEETDLADAIEEVNV
ncbi:MAG: restriction endonuclease subunit S [Halopseudomonas sabulinigri]